MTTFMATLLITESSAVARANFSDMESAFGNTVLSHYPDGGWVRHWFERDGGYRAAFSDGRTISGNWTREGDRLCLNDIRPRLFLSRFCSKFTPVRFGESWTARDPLGRRVRNELVRGRSH
ncbi:MAG: hypothetical protein RR935_08135 [Brevundimonas sp.]